MLACMIIMYAIFLCTMPLYADDLWFSVFIKDDPGLTGMWTTWREHFKIDNARLSNIVLVPLLLMPKWVGSMGATLCWGWALCKGGVTAGLRPDQWPGWAIWLTLTCFLLPWYDSIGSMCYQLNYLVATALTLCATCIATERKMLPPILYFVVGTITGMWHEGFSIPLLAGLIVATFCFRWMRNKHVYALTIGLFAGIIWLSSSPGIISRFTVVSDPSRDYFFRQIGFKTLLHPGLLLLLGAIAVALLRRVSLRTLTTPANTILFVSALVSYLIHLSSLLAPRSGWWCEFASMILLIRVCSVSRLYIRRPVIARGVAVAVGLLTLWRMTSVDVAAIDISRDFREALRQYAAAPGKTIFMNFVTEHDAPLINLFAPDYTLFISPYYSFFHNYYLNAPESAKMIVIPAKLRYITAQSGESIDGNAGVRHLDATMFMPSDSLVSYQFSADIDFGLIQKRGVRMLAFPFHSEADGRRYVWIYPWRQVVAMKLGKINRIDLNSSIPPRQ